MPGRPPPLARSTILFFSKGEMIKESVSVTQTELDVEHAKPRAGDPHVLIADSTKFREATGWEPTYTTREMIETAYKAYRKVSK